MVLIVTVVRVVVVKDRGRRGRSVQIVRTVMDSNQ